MSSKNELPDELWRKILEIGIKSSNFIFKDLCSISISCRRLHRLSNEDSLWSHLLSVDFPNQISSPPSSSSPKSLYKISQASVALNVWQPEVVRGRQKQTVEQCVVPVESRIHALEMEVKLCNQQLQVFDKAYRDENRRLDVAKEELQSMKYHPLRDYKLTSNESHENKMKRKKLKTCINFNVLTAPDKQGKTT
ncbi:F-box family protein, putative isoform 2 [Theobroma cacao]|uniref:F-box family protein, putative isoform 2 n=1 Tax=Theobroma cacao TaxID=3641 RepID=A0A061F0J0_THECC|nr:F-box family protein, putative isoform 2 [Theobroma cacao]